MLLVSLIPLYVAAPLPAEKNVNPGFNSYYENADVEQWQGVFEREGREVWDKREEIVLRLGLKPGMAAASSEMPRPHAVAIRNGVQCNSIGGNFVR